MSDIDDVMKRLNEAIEFATAKKRETLFQFPIPDAIALRDELQRLRKIEATYEAFVKDRISGVERTFLDEALKDRV